jgi:N6-adenosine-specific RNA methylase IME4
MTHEQLKEIKLPSADDSFLFLWTTHRFIWDAKELLNHWGFEYKAIMVWDKEKMGIGRWLRMQCEFCLVGSEKRTTHSTKPETFYKIIDENCIGRKLDYFARKKREGWDVFGDEV